MANNAFEGFGRKLLTKIIAVLLVAAIGTVVPFVLEGCNRIVERPNDDAGTSDVESTPAIVDTDELYTFDLGFSVKMPSGFTEQETEMNDFFGVSAGQNWAIIANKDEKDGHTAQTFATSLAEVNGADSAMTDVNGNYYISYDNDEQGYHFYTTILEGSDAFYRISFYCEQSTWTLLGPSIIKWAATATLTE